MNKMRIRFSKKDWMVFISHLDLMRTMERVLRRGNIPLVFSHGFNPHPKMAFSTALALGISSDGEYMDIEVEEEIDLDVFKSSINDQLPKGLKIIQCKYVDVKSKALMAIAEYSTYTVRCCLIEEHSEEELKKQVADFMANEEIILHKTIKKKNIEQIKEVNIRPFIKNIEIINKEDGSCIFKMTLATGSKGNLKPEVVIEKLAELKKTPIVLEKIRIHRLDLYGVNNGKLVTPLEINV
ncbi:TIGR03936 family radical SAM-associated protein [Marinisporobacter balticus]|uniref:Radical SAM-linked protein n=1 Tax=Marinisporobacter balticus TaxID=2018667 RepID=A0A4R2L139_9FIRM|nr:TIGR03936 family radical SAM-associated protein [Marinisporobacter balticus]TCO79973.1 radical SAM-linked protein [Marinisporobacter balticus]